MAKKPKRYVRFDNGYGCHENWQTGRVIESRTCTALFSGETEDLLVEVAGGERKWISFWEEIP
jgi:hypothetical protein